MATMNVSLPDAMKDWVEAQTAAGRYSNPSDYVRDLIRRDQERAETLSGLQQAFDEGFESGVSDRSIEAILDAARANAQSPGLPSGSIPIKPTWSPSSNAAAAF